MLEGRGNSVGKPVPEGNMRGKKGQAEGCWGSLPSLLPLLCYPSTTALRSVYSFLFPLLDVKAPGDGNGNEALSADLGSQKPPAAKLVLAVHSLCSEDSRQGAGGTLGGWSCTADCVAWGSCSYLEVGRAKCEGQRRPEADDRPLGDTDTAPSLLRFVTDCAQSTSWGHCFTRDRVGNAWSCMG